MKKILLSLLTLGFGAFTLNAQTLDQSNTSSQSATFLVNSGANTTVGQSFTAGMTGFMSSVSINLDASNPFLNTIAGNFTLTIRSGAGYGGAILGIDTFAITGTEPSGFLSIPIKPNTVSITSGNSYTYIIDEISGTGQINIVSSNNTYAGGDLYSQVFTNPPNLDATRDFVFQTFVSIPTIPTCTLDQTFPLPTLSTTINGIGSGQSFTAGLCGTLTSVVINIKDQSPTASSSDIRIRIIDGAGTCGSTILADETFLNITEFQNFSFNLSNPPKLSLGQSYTILLSTTDGSLCNIAFGTGGYPSGDFYSGITCTPFGGGNDFWFETCVDNLDNQTVTASQTTLCDSGAVTISTGSSETGINYFLRNDADSSIVDGPIAGTGSGLTFNTGTINATTTYNVYAKEPKISAVDLPANTDLIQFTNPFFAYTNEITIEAWVDFKGTLLRAGQSSAAVDNMATNVWLWDAGSFFVNNNGTWIGLLFPTTIPTGWTHVATVANASGMFIYYNGVLVASNSTGITAGIRNNSNSVIDLGHDPRFAPSVRNNNHSFDNFAVWNVARTATEIATNLNNCLIGTEPGLVQYTLMNEGTGTTLSSLAGATGTITNGIPNPWVLGSDVCDGACDLEMTQTVTITVNSSPTATTTQTNVSCNGGTNGTATVTPTGGTAPYTYLWSNAATTATATGLAAGVYNVTITDANGCTTNVSNITITEPTALAGSVTSQTNLACNGGTNGSATVSATGGTAPYTYLWSNAATTATATGLAAGIYNVTITDANGCTTNVSNITITEPTALAGSVTSQTNLACNGGTNGSATVSATGGTAPYTYLWSNAATTATATGLAAGIYNVTITDANGCTTNVSNITITEPTALTSAITSQTNVSCNGGVNGAASVSATGGTPSYTYLWSNAATTATATGLAAGNYNVTITDANGCTSNVSNIAITEPAIITGTDVQTACNTFTWIDNNTYTSSNNTATFNIFGGAANGCDSLVTLDLTINTVDNTTSLNVDTITANQAGATYRWLDCDNGNAIIAGATNQSFVPSISGNYAVEVTFNGCTDTSACFIVSTNGQCTVDQQFLGVDTRQSLVTSSGLPHGQSFRASISGQLNSVSLELIAQSVGCISSNMNVKVEVLDGDGVTGPVLASQVFTLPDFFSRSMRSFNFTNPAMITANQLYTITISLVPGQICGAFGPVLNWFFQFPTNFWATTGGTQYDNGVIGSLGNTRYFSTCVSCIVDNTTTLNVDTITANQAGATYQWLDCNNGNAVIAGATAQSFRPSATGNYAVEITFNGCIDTSACTNVIITNIDESIMENVNIFPNPTKDDIYVELPLNEFASFEVKIYSVTGKLVYNASQNNVSKLSISTANWDKGLYFIQLISNNQTIIEKIIKQ
ncbi:MAG: T9SS type A sorting domain-containing protein [Vicingaceae bacterium]|nr:T9SS type A sorting domain-containing protein [Vicingaceae bacterium]